MAIRALVLVAASLNSFQPSAHGERYGCAVSNFCDSASPTISPLVAFHESDRPTSCETYAKCPGVTERWPMSAGQMHSCRVNTPSTKFRAWPGEKYAFHGPRSKSGLSQRGSDAFSLPRLTSSQPLVPMNFVPA